MNIPKIVLNLGLLLVTVTSALAQSQGQSRLDAATPKDYSEVRQRLFAGFELDNRTLRTVGATDQQINRVGLINGEMLQTMDRLGPAFDRSRDKAEADKIMAQIEQAFVRRMNRIGRVIGPDLYKKFLKTTAELTAKLEAETKKSRAESKAVPKSTIPAAVAGYLDRENLAISQLGLSSAQIDKYGALVRSEMVELTSAFASSTEGSATTRSTRLAYLSRRSDNLRAILGTKKYQVFEKLMTEFAVYSRR